MFRFRKYWWLLAALLLFFAFVFLKSRLGVVFFGDNNISLWKENKYLLNPYLWIDDDYGYYFPFYIFSFPFQAVFRLLNSVFNIYLVSNFYFYGSFLFFSLTSLYLLREINDKADKIDYLIIGLYSIANPLISSQLIGECDVCYSLAFINLFVGYLFRIFKKKSITLGNIFILFLLILFINSYIFNTFLLLISLFLSLLIFSQRIIREGKLKLILVLFLFLGLNLFWIIIPLYGQLRGLGIKESLGYDPLKANSLYVLAESSNAVKAFTPFMIAPQYITNEGHPFSFYSTLHIISINLFFFIFVIYENFLKKGKDKRREKILDCFLIIILFFYVFSLGINPYFKEFFWFFWKFVPLFNVFRSIVKFLYPIYFAFVILLIFALEKIANRKRLKLLLLISLVPLVLVYLRPGFLQLIRNYRIPGYYWEFEKEMSQEKLIGYNKVLPDLPSPGFGYTAFNWNPNNSDSSNVLLFFSRQDIAFRPLNAEAMDSSIADLFCSREMNSDTNQLDKVLGLLNIKRIILQKDVKFSPCNFEMIEGYQKKQIGELDIFIPKNEDFVPRIYVPQTVVKTQKSKDQLKEILSEQNNRDSLAVFFSKGVDGVIRKNLEWVGGKEKFPVIEFKKINPIKYRLIIHRAPDVFPIVFSQSYHPYWQLYVTRFGDSLINKTNWETANYQIHKENNVVQASKQELVEYVQEGWITHLAKSPSGNIDFVSKNFKGTIQNDNLPRGRIYETWFSSFSQSIYKVPQENHYQVNGYANSWLIETQKICSQGNICKRNPDGSYELEMVIEFWAQRLQYLGFAVSGLTFIGFISYFFINRFMRLKKQQ